MSASCVPVQSIACVALLLFLGVPALAHDSRPLYIDLTETAPLRYVLKWKSPPSIPILNLPTVSLSNDCKASGPTAEFADPEGVLRRASYQCLRPVARRDLAIKYPGPNPSISSFVRYKTLSGERHTAILGPQETQWQMPEAETTSAVANQYTRLGIQHIWGGIDHLLFLVCLLWIAGTWIRILITITGFTLAHSATLILSALDVVRLPISPVEAAIALSIVFLATELVKGPRHSVTWRYPIAVSSSFGLLHGFGFAAALSEIGLPQTELVTGLLFFNAGVEIGQVLFAVGVIGLVRLVQRFAAEWVPQAYQVAMPRTAVGYIVGTLAVFWLIERSASFSLGG